jgi:hypothetical protein
MSNDAVITRKNGEVIQLSNLSDQLVRELLGVNGNGNGHVPSKQRTRKQPVSMRINDDTPDYAGFKKALSDRGRKFVDVLRQYPNGIVAEEFAPKIGLQNPVQIGGITGGGLAKLANRFNVKLSDIYMAEKKFENGTRQTIYRPGKDISKV